MCCPQTRVDLRRLYIIHINIHCVWFVLHVVISSLARTDRCFSFFSPVICTCFPLCCCVYCKEKRSCDFAVPALFAMWQGNVQLGWPFFYIFFKCRGAFKELSAVVRFTALNFCLLVCFGSHILELSWGVAHGIYVQANVRIYVDWWSSQAKYQITHKLGCTLFCGDMTWPLNSLQGILPLKPKYEKRSFRMKWMTINVDTRVECFEHETLCHSSMHALSVMS